MGSSCRMLSAYLFDLEHGDQVESWAETLGTLGDDSLLWIDLAEPTRPEIEQVCDALDLGDPAPLRLGEAGGKPRLEQHEGNLRVIAVAVSDEESDAEREEIVVDCLVGPNWIVTAHAADIAALDDFRRAAEGQGELGGLDAPSFLATLLEWVVVSYIRAFDEIEATLEELDVKTLSRPVGDPEEQIGVLVGARRRVGRLRRSLAPHLELFGALSHSEFDPISSPESAAMFESLTARVDSALSSARDAREGITSSFDVLIVRTEYRTNQIVKVLTLASILLLPGSLIAGVAGMNVNFAAHAFASSGLFWSVVAAIVAIALGTLVFARSRRWI
jgi:magnesium transporter